ncbi:hypothetical protein KCV87_18255 [Actinosynnema pretiosum subsp. pretiosum]|uniref:Uncharacterized protein n=1 Tax=Actinosynnema pretiosum subsp. pretiosum TaxID=103721 RepID=A0AA45L211_9PSEU|nr:hypothetical protein KCV87_18255 [Actinosynnema pretiosum subsp. pretiosum]
MTTPPEGPQDPWQPSWRPEPERRPEHSGPAVTPPQRAAQPVFPSQDAPWGAPTGHDRSPDPWPAARPGAADPGPGPQHDPRHDPRTEPETPPTGLAQFGFTGEPADRSAFTVNGRISRKSEFAGQRDPARFPDFHRDERSAPPPSDDSLGYAVLVQPLGPGSAPAPEVRYRQPWQPTHQERHPHGPVPAHGTGLARRTKIVLALAAVVPLAAIVALSFGGEDRRTAVAGAEAGDCLKVNEVSRDGADVEMVDCAAGDAAYRVAVNLPETDRCPPGDYDEYIRGGAGNRGFRLCLMLNATDGDCFKEEGGIAASKTTKVRCGSGATYKVAKAHSGTVDELVCEFDENPRVYPTPPTTLCITDP